MSDRLPTSYVTNMLGLSRRQVEGMHARELVPGEGSEKRPGATRWYALDDVAALALLVHHSNPDATQAKVADFAKEMFDCVPEALDPSAPAPVFVTARFLKGRTMHRLARGQDGLDQTAAALKAEGAFEISFFDLRHFVRELKVEFDRHLQALRQAERENRPKVRSAVAVRADPAPAEGAPAELAIAAIPADRTRVR